MSKEDMRRDIKLLRNQMATLEKKCQSREDALVELIRRIEPFLPAISDAGKKVIETYLEEVG